MFRVGSSMTGAPRVYMKRGATGYGQPAALYSHPSLDKAVLHAVPGVAIGTSLATNAQTATCFAALGRQ